MEGAGASRNKKPSSLAKNPEKCGRPDDSEDFQFKKRLPPSFPRTKNDIFVNQKSSFISQFNKCKTMLLSGEKELTVHGMGASVNTAVNLALQLKSYFADAIVLHPTTSTVHLVDDFIPKTNKGKYKTNHRKNSAVHIKVSYGPSS